MIQFNLLPDVKLEYIRARRTKHSVLLIASLVAGASLSVMIILFLAVNGLQKKHLSDINKDIKTYTKKLESTTDLGKVLTIQNQLKSLPALHNQKPVTSRLFVYISQIIPAQISIASMDVDYAAHTMQFEGSADSLATVNTFVDTLKFTTYSTKDGSITAKNAFSSVVLSSFSRSDKEANYTVTLTFNQDIFDSSKDVIMTVPPGKITTRSETEKPADLFKPADQKVTP